MKGDMNNTVAISLSDDFLAAANKLPSIAKGKIFPFIVKFRSNPLAPGFNLEKLKYLNAQNLYSARVDDTYRAIIGRQSDGPFFFLWVDHHDKAYDWAKNRKFVKNLESMEPQVFQIVSPVKTQESINIPALFSHIRDRDFVSLGLPKEQLPFVRSLTDPSEIYRYRESFPTSVFEALSFLLTGMPVEEILARAEALQEDKPQVTGTQIEPQSSRSFYVVEEEDELQRILEEPLEEWRIFLHPAQERLVKRHYSGPARVLGGAGTGKTVVAMHRAKYLASKMKGEGRILFTTFTVNLIADIEHNLRKICSLRAMNRIDVHGMDDWAVQFMQKNKYEADVSYGDEIKKAWEEAIKIAGANLDLPVNFFEHEWSHVIVPEETHTLGQYLRMSQKGQTKRCSQEEKIQIWNVFQAYKEIMKAKKLRDIHWLMRDCIDMVTKQYPEGVYRHIIVDEAQDLSPCTFQLIRALAGPKSDNDLFIVGDAHQRIYKNKVVLSKCGIDVDGRGGHLYINYRTTEEIRKFAFATLHNLRFDDLDGTQVIEDRCMSLTRGDTPKVLDFKNQKEEMNFVLKEIERLQEAGTPLRNICIVARRNRTADHYAEFFKEENLQCFQVKRSRVDDRGLDGVRLATMHRVKGLEFPYVFLVSANAGEIPPASIEKQQDLELRQESINREKCLLYVAMTRAQKGVWITSFGRRSNLINSTS